jgi:hypothetical protein
MTDSHQPEQSAGETSSGQDQTSAQSENQAGEGAARQAPSAEAQPTEAEDTEAEDTEAEDTQAEDTQAEDTQAEDPQARDAPVAGPTGSKKGLLLGLGGAAVGVVIAVLVIAAFAWPGFLAGPGKPDDTAARAVAALASKDPGELDKISCHGPDGKPTPQLPPQALQLIQAAKQTGAPQLLLDTQAQAPVDLTLSAQGQTQDLPAAVVLGVTNGEWCMNGISQQQ